LANFNTLSLIIDEDSMKELNLSPEEIEYLAEKRQEVLVSLGKLA